MADWTDKDIQRRAINYSGFRLDGLTDLYSRARDATIFDVGCNRGAVCDDLVYHGAKIVHGCDNFETGVKVANERFADVRSVTAKFEVVDLTGGLEAIRKAFGKELLVYDIMIMLAVYHKLRRVMPLEKLLFLVEGLAKHTGRFFAWRGSRDELPEMEPVLLERGFRRVHYSEICEVRIPESQKPVVQPTAIWAKTDAVYFDEILPRKT